MMAVVSQRVIPEDYLRRQGRLSTEGKIPTTTTEAGHHDGWGVVHYREGYPAILGREPTDAATDPNFAEVVEKVAELRPRGILLAHLRKASVGGVAKENTQPFVHENWAFGHNGTIHDFDLQVRLKLQGTSDSERFFKALVERMERGLTPREATEAVTGLIRGKYKFSSLTFLLSDGTNLYGYREFSRDQDYYTLAYAKREGHVLVAQEPIVGGSWVPVPPRAFLTVGQDLAISLRAL